MSRQSTITNAKSWDGQKKAKTPRYHVGISFAGEDRDCARILDAALREAGLTVFFDENEQHTLWGVNLFAHLQDVYRNRCASVIILVSQQYAIKHWAQHEFRSAQEKALISQGYILPIMLGNVELPGLPSTTGFIRWDDLSPRGIAELVAKKFGLP